MQSKEIPVENNIFSSTNKSAAVAALAGYIFSPTAAFSVAFMSALYFNAYKIPTRLLLGKEQRALYNELYALNVCKTAVMSCLFAAVWSNWYGGVGFWAALAQHANPVSYACASALFGTALGYIHGQMRDVNTELENPTITNIIAAIAELFFGDDTLGTGIIRDEGEKSDDLIRLAFGINANNYRSGWGK
jgi:hypothetical protein